MTGPNEHVIATGDQLSAAAVIAYVDGTPEQRQAIVDVLTARERERQGKPPWSAGES